MAVMSTEESAITEAFKIRMTCTHSLFHVFTDNKSSNCIVGKDGLAEVGDIRLKALKFLKLIIMLFMS